MNLCLGDIARADLGLVKREYIIENRKPCNIVYNIVKQFTDIFEGFRVKRIKH